MLETATGDNGTAAAPETPRVLNHGPLLFCGLRRRKGPFQLGLWLLHGKAARHLILICKMYTLRP
jgi:hypothetical protein